MGPLILSGEEMKAIMEKYRTYGQKIKLDLFLKGATMKYSVYLLAPLILGVLSVD